jgi:hypothetical protein
MTYVENMPRVDGDFVWTGTGGLSDTQSYTWIILNAIYDRIVATSLFSGFVCKRISAALPIEAGIQIPFIGIYGGSEELSPDGDLNAGEIRLTHHVPIGFQIVIRNNDPTLMLKKLDELGWFLMNQVLRDDSLTNLWRNALPDNTRFEGVESGYVRDRWFIANRTTATETPMGERQIKLTLVFRTMWYPTDFPDLHRITVRTAWPEGSTAGEQLEVQQVTMVYEFDATTGEAVPFPLPDDTEPPPNPFP